MSKLYAIAGRPGSGKTEYLKFIRTYAAGSFQIVSALDYNTHADLMKELYELVQDNTCRCIAIDDYEVITYDDKTKFNKVYWVDGNYFAELFDAIKRFIPDTENIPLVLCTGNDRNI